MKRAFLPLIIAAIIVASLASTCLAQAEFDIAVFPSKIEIEGIPGTTQEFEINVRNTGTEDQSFVIYFMDYLVKPNNEFVFKKPGHYSYSCAKWLSTEVPELSVPAGQTAKKRFMLEIPEDAEPGGHYGVIFFEQVTTEESGEVRARGRLGSTVFVTVPGEIVRKGEIESVSVTSSWFWPSKRVLAGPRRVTNARVVFRNEGNVHLTVKGKATYTPTFGWGAGTVDLGEITVLPGTTRYLEAEIPNPPLLGSYKVSAEVSYGPSLEVFDTTLTAEATFHQYPFLWLAVILAIAVLVAALVILIRWLRRKRKGKGGKPGDASTAGGDAGDGRDEKEAESEDEAGEGDADSREEGRPGEVSPGAGGAEEEGFQGLNPDEIF